MHELPDTILTWITLKYLYLTPAKNLMINKGVRNVTRTTICKANSGLTCRHITINFG